MQNSMTNRQLVLFIIIICTTMSSTTIAQTMALSAGSGAWVTLLITALISGLLVAVVMRLGRMFEGKTLYEYSRDIGGRFLPYVLGVFFILYFVLMDTNLCLCVVSMVHANFMLKTPEWALIAVLLPVLGLIAHRGVTVAARLVEIFSIWYIAVVLILEITMLLEGNLNYIQPLFNPSDTGRYLLSVKEAFPSFLGYTLLFLVPLNKKNKKASKAVFFAMIAVGVFSMMDVYGCYAMIGLDEIVYHPFALIDAVRLVEYRNIEFWQRVDVMYLTFGLIRTFIGKAFFYTMIVELLCKMLPKAKRTVIVIIVGVALALTTIPLTGVDNITDILCNVLEYAGIIAAVVIPLSLWMIARIKKNGKKST